MKHKTTQNASLWYAKLYLLGLYLFVHCVALLDTHGIPYYPLELSSLVAPYHTRKAIFLAGMAPLSIVLWANPGESWPLKGIGVSLFLMLLFDVAHEWPLHLLSVLAFAFSVSQCTRYSKERKLLLYVVIIYTLRLLLVPLYLSIYEARERAIVLAALACSGYTTCAQPLLTPLIFKLSASLQWLSFGLLAMIGCE